MIFVTKIVWFIGIAVILNKNLKRICFKQNLTIFANLNLVYNIKLKHEKNISTIRKKKKK